MSSALRFALIVALVAPAMSAEAASPQKLAPARVALLTCGKGSFRLTSRSWAGKEAPLAPFSQMLIARVSGKPRPVAIEAPSTVRIDDWRVRGAYIISWACVRAASGRHYVDLGYTCAADPGTPGDCAGDKEWFRLLDDRGRYVDAGVPRSGDRRTALLRRLGLAQAMAKGVTMTPVTE